VPSGDGMW